MIDVSLQSGVIALFIVAAVVLGATTGVTITYGLHLSGASDDPSIAVGIFIGMISALGWFLALVGLFDIGGPLVLKVTEGGAWGLAIAALVGAVTFGLATGIMATHVASSVKSEPKDKKKQERAMEFGIFWGFGVFTASAIGWFTLLVWMFNGSHIVQ